MRSTLYLDESGIGGDTGHMVLAGYQASEVTWKLFSVDWVSVLSDPPAIPLLHMKEANSLRGCFEGWVAEERDQKLVRLVDVILRHRLVGRVAHVRIADYDAVLRGKISEDADNPIYSCFLRVFQDHLAAMVKGRWRPMDTVFDNHEKHSPYLSWAYHEMRPAVDISFPGHLGQVWIANSARVVLPIQAADVLAWHVHRSLTRPDGADRPLYQRLREYQDLEVHAIDREYLGGIVRQVRAGRRRGRRARR